MKYFTLVWAGLWRKRVRTMLTLLCVAVAFLLFGLLNSVTSSLDAIVESMSDARLRTMSRLNLLEPLPLAYLPRISAIPGVEAVGHLTIFFGYYQDPADGINSVALDVDHFLDAYPEFVVPPDQRAAMRETRTGALIGEDLAAEHGWNIGDRIPISSRRWAQRDGSQDWAFDVVGIVTSSKVGAPVDQLWINFDYFDEARAEGNGFVNMFIEAIDDPEHAADISAAIDGLFANSANETDTMTDKDFIRAQIDQIGDIGFFVNAIVGAVLFTLLFLTGNTMMQSVRERIPELAILMTYGFTDVSVIALVWAEALVLCGVSAGIGLGLAKAVFPGIFASIGAPALPMPMSVVAAGFALAALFALVSSVSPAWRIRRISLVDALAGR
jgi:putative ABC transport system permease protein